MGFVLIYIEQWTYPYLFLFPIITWFGTLFFCMLTITKASTQPKTDKVSINPLNSEKHLWLIFLVSSILQMIILLILGWDAKIHPQLMDNYAHFFILPVFIIFCLTWFWLMWFSISGSHAKIQNRFSKDVSEQTQSKSRDIIISTFNIKKRKRYEIILIAGWLIIIAITVIDSLFVFLTTGIKGLWKVKIHLPQYTNSEMMPLYFSGLIYLILILFPLLAGIIVQLIIKKFKVYYNIIIEQLEHNETILNSSEKSTILHGFKSFKI